MPLNELAEVVALAGDALQDPAKLDETLEHLLASAAQGVPGFQHSALSIRDRSGEITCSAATSALARDLEGLQAASEKSPLLEVLAGFPTLVVPAIRVEQRWPRYVAGALARGVCAQVTARFQFDQTGLLGALTLYATGEAEVDPDAASLVEVYAAHAAVAIGGVQMVEGLGKAMESRKTIGQALGIVMERYGLDQDRALAYLRRESSHRNIKLRDLAHQVVLERDRSAGGVDGRDGSQRVAP